MLDVKRNLTTMTDFYELTMSAGYLDEGYVDKIAVFDMFFRRVPDGGGYAIMAGLQQFIDAVDHLEFTGEDIDYLRSTKAFDEKFLTYLANFKLHCNIWAIDCGLEIGSHCNEYVDGHDNEREWLEPVLLAYAPAVFDHHEADAAGQRSIELGIMEPAVHIQIGLIVQSPFGSHRSADLYGYEIDGKCQRHRKEGYATSEFCPAGKLIEKNQAQKDPEHGKPLIDCHISINMEKHRFIGLVLLNAKIVDLCFIYNVHIFVK